MRYAITIEYDGTAYSGWQRQLNAISVQEVLEDALSFLLKEKIVLHASGRTDRGVHASGQVAHFDTCSEMTPYKMRYVVNALLPEDVRIIEMREAEPDFHAQYDAVSKTYEYRTYVSDTISPLRSRYAARIMPPVDVDKMRRALDKLKGVHDFKAFGSTGSSVKTTVREIYDIGLEERGDELIFRITGSGFLYNMVRIIVGTVVQIGKGKLPEESIDKMLRSGERKLGGKTFPAEALTLVKVEYPAGKIK